MSDERSIAVEGWAAELKTPAWVLAGLLVQYPRGSEMTLTQYEAACMAVRNHVPSKE